MNESDLCASSALVQEGNNDTQSRLESNIVFTTVYFSIGLVIDVSCVIAFAIFKRRFERTRLRPTVLVLMAACASLCQMFYGCLQTITRGSLPCSLTVILPIMVVPFIGTSISGKLVVLLYLSKFTEASIKDKAGDKRDTNLSSAMTSSSATKVTLCSAYKTGFRLLFFNSNMGEQTAQEVRDDLYQLHFLKSRRGVGALAFIFVMPFLTFALIMMGTNPVYIYCTNCSISSTMQIGIVSVTVATIIVGAGIWWRTRKLRDAWGLANEAFISILAACVGLMGFLLTQFHNRFVFETYSHQFVLSLGLWLIVVEQTVVQLFLGWRSERRHMRTGPSRQDTDGTGDAQASAESLEAIMRDKHRSKQFESHLAEEFGLESLLFLRDVERWKETFFDVDESARIGRARMLEKTFIRSDGLYAINVSSATTSRITETLNRVGSDSAPALEASLFDEAVDEVSKLLNSGAVQRFVNRTSRHNSRENNAASSVMLSDASSAGPSLYATAII